jgi:tetratricopeptide (TPR) repeat protein
MRTNKRFWLVLPLTTLLLTACGGPSSLSYMRGSYYQRNGDNHYAKEDPLTDEGIQEYRKAIDQYDAAIKLQHGYVDALTQRGLCHWHIKEYNEALQDFSEAIALQPGKQTLWKDRAWVYRDMEIYDKAVEDFAQAIKINGDDANSWLGKGECELKLKELPQCLADLEKASQLQPHEADIYCQRATAYRIQGDYNKMDEEYDKALALREHNPDLHQWKAYSEFIAGRYDKAIASLNRVKHVYKLERYRSAPYTVILANLACRLSGKKEDAEEWLDEGVSKFHLPLASQEGKFDATVSERWPYPALQFLHGDISAQQLIDYAKDNRDRTTEAYCYIGLSNKAGGMRPDSYKKYFQWIADHGTKNFVEYDIACAQLAQPSDQPIHAPGKR